MEYQDYLIEWLKQQVKRTKTQGLLVGISGGIDSALVGALIKKAMPNNSLGIIMPIEKMIDINDAHLVINHLNLTSKIVDLTTTYQAIVKSTQVKSHNSLINIKPRLRMVTLYALAQELNYLVVGTDNAAEWLLGYFTKYGDGGVDLAPIIHLNKGEVRNMARKFNIPEQIINKIPTAGLFDNQTDEEELGFSYDVVDKYLKGQKIANNVATKIKLQSQKTAHKREPILTPAKPWKISKNINK